METCPQKAIYLVDGVAQIDPQLCQECLACLSVCPTGAIAQVETPAPVQVPIKVSVPQEQPPAVVSEPAQRTGVVMPLVGATLAFLGREVAPRLALRLVDALERRLSRGTESVSAVPTQSVTGATSPIGRRGGRGLRRRWRRRGR